MEGICIGGFVLSSISATCQPPINQDVGKRELESRAAIRFWPEDAGNHVLFEYGGGPCQLLWLAVSIL